jgi:YrbI family 3-deoxy-D-manno-octulosonate 8-phosphate phosphatase
VSEIERKCQSIQLILSDVDGVLSNGTIWYDNQCVESKAFHARDGLGIDIWHLAGYKFGLVTGRSSEIVRHRAAELKMTIVRQGISDKLEAVREILGQLQLTFDQVCFIGDDLPDIPPIRHAALGVAVADAVPEAITAADYVTQHRGGQGAVRETIELILKHQQRWEDIVQRFGG